MNIPIENIISFPHHKYKYTLGEITIPTEIMGCWLIKIPSDFQLEVSEEDFFYLKNGKKLKRSHNEQDYLASSNEEMYFERLLTKILIYEWKSKFNVYKVHHNGETFLILEKI